MERGSGLARDEGAGAEVGGWVRGKPADRTQVPRCREQRAERTSGDTEALGGARVPTEPRQRGARGTGLR